MEQKIEEGDPIYVPSSERAAALSLGAVVIEGDSRLFIPKPLPRSVRLVSFARWASESARMIWVSEYLEDIFECRVDMNDIAGLIDENSKMFADEHDQRVPLYVPKFEMDNVRIIPGVEWDRRRRCYVADFTADFGLIYPYLTPGMRAIWIAERNTEQAMHSLVKAQSMVVGLEDGGESKALERKKIDDESLGQK